MLVFYPRAGAGARCRFAGRTLLELLVVIAIIALLTGLFLTGAHWAWNAVNRLR
jgi:prepilin-type N-terminal cleavage/methylation domain-containing protein